MRQRILCLLGVGLFLWAGRVESAPDVTMSFATATDGATITASEHNTVRNETASDFNSHDHNDIDQTGTPLNVGASSGRTSIGDASLVLEGATVDGSETTFSVTDPTADRTISFPNGDVTVANTGLTLEGATDDAVETTLSITDPTSSDRTITFPDATGSVPVFANTNTTDVNLIFEGATANDFETTVTVTDPTADRTVTVGNGTFTVDDDRVLMAWCKFDGTAGTPACADSVNVTSITDGGVGIYTLNWTTAFATANYGVVCTSSSGQTETETVLAGSVLVQTSNSSGTLEDATVVVCMATGDV